MTEIPNGPWENLRADLFGPLPSNEYILVVQCLCSRFPAVEIVSSTSAAAAIPAIDKILTNFGIPYKLGSDNGPPFNSRAFTEFADHMGFRHVKVTPYAPWANGTVEHFMRNLGKILRTSNITNQSWKPSLQSFLRLYRATPHCTTGYAPAQLLFNNRQYKTRLPNAKTDTELYQQQQVKENDRKHKETAKEKADKKSYVKSSDLQVGDYALCRQQRKSKITPPYDPIPYVITTINGSQVTAKNDIRNIKRHITHFKKLKGCVERHRRPISPTPASSDSDEMLSDSDETIPYNEPEDDFQQPIIRRPRRERRVPLRYRDE